MNAVDVIWRKCVQRVFRLNSRKHSRFLPIVASQLNPMHGYVRRKLSLFTAVLYSYYNKLQCNRSEMEMEFGVLRHANTKLVLYGAN